MSKKRSAQRSAQGAGQGNARPRSDTCASGMCPHCGRFAGAAVEKLNAGGARVWQCACGGTFSAGVATFSRRRGAPSSGRVEATERVEPPAERTERKARKSKKRAGEPSALWQMAQRKAREAQDAPRARGKEPRLHVDKSEVAKMQNREAYLLRELNMVRAQLHGTSRMPVDGSTIVRAARVNSYAGIPANERRTVDDVEGALWYERAQFEDGSTHWLVVMPKWANDRLGRRFYADA